MSTLFSLLLIRYASTRSLPPPDASQDISNTSATLANGRLTFIFTRRLDTGDTAGDIVLNMCHYILFASGSVRDFPSRAIVYHGANRALSRNRVCLCECEYNYHIELTS